MTSLNIFNVLQRVYGARGIPFPNRPLDGDGSAIATGFTYNGTPSNDDGLGAFIKEYTDEQLGQYVFMPVEIDGYKLPNPIIMLSGEKIVIETDMIDVGTAFEKVFMRPYDITIICTLIGENKKWPQEQLKEIADLWKDKTLVTLKAAISNLFLQPKNNMIWTKMSILDNDGAESVEVIQIDGRTNVDFELEIK